MAATSGVAKVNVNDTVFLQRQMSWWVINFFCAAMDTWCRVCPCFKAKALHSMRWWWLGVIVATGQSEMYLLQWVWLILQCQRLHDSKIQYALLNKYVCCQNQDYLTLSSGSQPPSMLHQSKCPYVNPFGPYGSISPGQENGQSVAFFGALLWPNGLIFFNFSELFWRDFRF